MQRTPDHECITPERLKERLDAGDRLWRIAELAQDAAETLDSRIEEENLGA
jgi:hypothetical protein